MASVFALLTSNSGGVRQYRSREVHCLHLLHNMQKHIWVSLSLSRDGERDDVARKTGQGVNAHDVRTGGITLGVGLGEVRLLVD